MYAVRLELVPTSKKVSKVVKILTLRIWEISFVRSDHFKHFGGTNQTIRIRHMNYVLVEVAIPPSMGK